MALSTEHWTVPLAIGGSMAAGEDGTYRVLNPAHPDEVVLVAPAASMGQLDAAVAGARSAQASWAGLGLEARVACLQAACQQAVETIDLENTSDLLTQEHGKIRMEALFDLATTAGMVGPLATLVAESLEPRLHTGTVVERVPHGVVAAILPFNWPAAVMGNKIIPALLTGNTVVVKVPPTCPGAVLALAGAIAGHLPPGVLNTLNGPSVALGAALVAHPGVDMVSFTGGVAAGRAVLAACAPHLRPAVLELGGNDPAVVAPDVEPTEELAGRILEAAFTTSGQVCMAIKRLYVPAARRSEWRDALVAGLARTVVGDGLDDQVTMGPVHTEAARDRVEGMLASAAASAAEVVRPATVIDPGHGWRVSPALVFDPDPDAPLVREEQFAPALPILSYDDLDAAVAAANDTPFGLCASVWSDDLELADRTSERLEAGTVWVNAHGMAAMDHLAPMGGWGQSGVGLELGVEGMAALTRPRVLRKGAR
jgi:acyl-CoA reductase-like NAD-dependent aldehyde dehydrogenase